MGFAPPARTGAAPRVRLELPDAPPTTLIEDDPWPAIEDAARRLFAFAASIDAQAARKLFAETARGRAGHPKKARSPERDRWLLEIHDLAAGEIAAGGNDRPGLPTNPASLPADMARRIAKDPALSRAYGGNITAGAVERHARRLINARAAQREQTRSAAEASRRAEAAWRKAMGFPGDAQPTTILTETWPAQGQK